LLGICILSQTGTSSENKL